RGRGARRGRLEAADLLHALLEVLLSRVVEGETAEARLEVDVRERDHLVGQRVLACAELLGVAQRRQRRRARNAMRRERLLERAVERRRSLEALVELLFLLFFGLFRAKTPPALPEEVRDAAEREDAGREDRRARHLLHRALVDAGLRPPLLVSGRQVLEQ